MNDYEITYILRPSLEEADVDARAEQFAGIITGRGGEIVNTEKLGKKRLAYEIKDVREGHYVAVHYRSDAATSKEVERQLGLHEDVIRELTIALDKNALAAMKAALLAPPPQAPMPAPY